MKTFYATTTIGGKYGAGYFKIYAKTEEAARNIARENIGTNWAFMYDDIEDLHPLDKKCCHGELS